MTGGFAAFASRDFRFIALTRLLAGGSLQMVLTAVGFQVYASTHDPIDLGLVGLAQFLPMAGLALPAGQAADRFDRRRLVLLCIATMIATSTTLTLLSRASSPPLWATYALLVVVGVARSLYTPALSSLVPSIVTREQLPNAITWSSALWQAASVLGPMAAGAIFGLTGAAWLVHATAAGAYVVSFVAMLLVRRGMGKLDRRPASWATAVEGLRYVWSKKVLFGALSMDFVAVFLGGAPVLLPAFATDVLHVGAAGLGVLRAAPAIGAGLMTFALAFRPMTGGVGKILFASVAAFGVATVVFGFSQSFFVSLAALGALGAADMVSVVVRQSLVHLRTPDEMRGRVSAVNQVFVGASNELGDVESGVVAGVVGLVPCVVGGGLCTLAVVAIWSRWFKELRDAETLDDA